MRGGREVFLEEVASEAGEEQGCAFPGLEWPVEMHQAVTAQDLTAMACRRGELCDKGTLSLALVLLRDIPNQPHFSEERSLWAPGLCWKGHCDLTNRYSEAWSRGPGHLPYSLRPLMPPISPGLR